MELSKAISAAARFSAKGKDAADVLKQVRFVSNGNWVHATDGEVGCLVRSDVDVPDMVVGVDMVPMLAKHAVESVRLEDGTGFVSFCLVGGGAYAFEKKDDSFFPPVPPMEFQTFFELPDGEWADVQKVFHAAVKEGALVGMEGIRRPDLECVHFRKDRVEATDTFRIVIADVATGLEGKVPSRIFRYWPAGKVCVGQTKTHVWFQVGEDMYRYAVFQKGTYASGKDLREFLPEHVVEQTGVAVDPIELRDVFKTAAQVAPNRSVLVEFGPSRFEDTGGQSRYRPLTIKGVSDNGDYERTLKTVPDNHEVCDSIILDGKLMDELLRQVDTPRVRIQNFKDAHKSWLRIESGAITANVYDKTG